MSETRGFTQIIFRGNSVTVPSFQFGSSTRSALTRSKLVFANLYTFYEFVFNNKKGSAYGNLLQFVSAKNI